MTHVLPPNPLSSESVPSDSTCNSNALPQFIVGIDVASREVVAAVGPMILTGRSTAPSASKTESIANRERNLRSFLKGLPEGSVLIVESTGNYHRAICDVAYSLRIPVFMVDPYRVNAYRKADNQRAKTDACDARLLVRFGREKYHELRAYLPLSPEVFTLQTLLRLRGQVVQARVSTSQTFKATFQESNLCGMLQAPMVFVQEATQCLMAEFNRLIRVLEAQIRSLVRSSASLQENYQRLRQIPGVGDISATSLLCALERGEFKTAEAFVAYLGLDPVARESGQERGRRRLSKKGDPQVRCVLYMGATTCTRLTLWKDMIERHKARGLKHPQISCIIARRIATIAWCLVKKQVDFDPGRVFQQPILSNA